MRNFLEVPMRWVITFLHNDAEPEDVEVDERELAAAFADAMRRECPCHVVCVEEVPEESAEPSSGTPEG